MQCSLKDGSAKSIIEGLSQSGDQYDEAITCLTNRFDKPRQIHQTHVKMILESPQIRDGSGRELQRLHDTIQQHTRALRSLGKEPSPEFITSIIELKLDPSTMFEWQRQSQSSTDVPHYKDILEFLDSLAQASEVSLPLKRQSKPVSTADRNQSRSINSLATNATEPASSNTCILCKPDKHPLYSDKHPLYSCPRFRTMNHDQRISSIKGNGNCINCLSKGHFAAQCKSLHRCRKCSRPHHTLLHSDRGETRPEITNHDVSVNTTTPTNEFNHSPLLMTCQVAIVGPDGNSVNARALLDSGSSDSFISERVVQTLRLPCTRQNISISVVGGTSSPINVNSSAGFKVCSIVNEGVIINVNALVVSRVVRDLPTTRSPPTSNWKHLRGLRLADPHFNVPSRVDLLLGVDVFMEVLRNGRRKGDLKAPVAVETLFGWVLCGGINTPNSPLTSASVITCHTSIEGVDDILHKFWKIEEPSTISDAHLSRDERIAVQHFKTKHTRDQDGKFTVPLPRTPANQTIGESRVQAV